MFSNPAHRRPAPRLDNRGHAIKPAPVRVVVRDASGAILHDKHGDYQNRRFVDWLNVTLRWALNNGAGVVAYSLSAPAAGADFADARP